MTLFFASERLIYRRFMAEDAAAAFAFYGDPEVMRYGLTTPDEEPTQTAARIAEFNVHCDKHGFGPAAIVERKSDALIGFCGLIRMEDGGEVELAYRLRRDRWGMGYATEAARAWIDYGFSVCGLRRILVVIDPANARSLRVAAKLGLEPLGDTLYHGIPVLAFAASNRETRP